MGLFTGREVLNPKPRSCTLMDAVRDDDREMMRKTLEAGEDVTQVNAYMRTPLHKAAYYSGAPEVISSLVSRGADVNAVDKGNWTALHLAARNGHVEAMRLLLDAGTRTDVRDTKHGWTALHLAVIAGNIDGARLLVRADADVRRQGQERGGRRRRTLEENGLTMRDVTDDAVPGIETNGDWEETPRERGEGGRFEAERARRRRGCARLVANRTSFLRRRRHRPPSRSLVTC